MKLKKKKVQDYQLTLITRKNQPLSKDDIFLENLYLGFIGEAVTNVLEGQIF